MTTATPIAIARDCARAIAGGADPVHTIAAAVERYGAHRSGEHIALVCERVTTPYANVLRLLETHATIDARDVVRFLGVSRDVAYQRLERMARRRLLTRVRRGVYAAPRSPWVAP